MKLVKAFQTVTLAFAGLLVFSTAPAQSGNAVAKVNDVAIPQSLADVLIRNAVSQGQLDSSDLRTRIREILIDQELVTQEVVKKGLDKDSDVATQIEFSERQVLINAYMEDYLKGNPITEDLVRKEYENAKAQLGDKEYKARHILVKQEDEAKEIIAQLKNGVSFEELAAQKTEDMGSKNKGGDLDWAPPGSYVKPFADALVKLDKGQLTDTLVQTQFGWHIIRLDDERPAQVPAFEEVKGRIQQRMQQQLLQKVITDLRTKAKIE